ncbi:MAG: DUF2141 domain-containing protein [Pseudomonadota bacterium]
MRRAALALTAAIGTAPAVAGELAIDVSGAAPGGGTVYAALCEGALREANCRPAGAAPARADALRLTARGVAPGRYAAIVFQDANGNGRLDRNMVGYPKEPYAISNAPRGLPTFGKAAFTVTEEPGRIALRLRRP